MRRVLTLVFAVSMLHSVALQAAEFEQIGSFDFPTSASGAAQEHFLLGVGYLHSFGFVQAQSEFRRAQE
ncbi:MAG: hypothetical protein ACE37N_03455, partial [Pseudohongiellaceae bacterium]